MSDATERRLEWACREIEHLLREVSMLKNPEFWRLEAARQKHLPIGDPCRTMTEEEIDRTLLKQDAIAWSRPIWPCKVWHAQSDDAGKSPIVHTWWLPPLTPDKSDPRVTPGFAIARCVINGKDYVETSCYFPGLYEFPIDGDVAKSCVGRKLIDRLCRKGILTTEKSFSNPTGEPRIL